MWCCELAVWFLLKMLCFDFGCCFNGLEVVRFAFVGGFIGWFGCTEVVCFVVVPDFWVCYFGLVCFRFADFVGRLY